MKKLAIIILNWNGLALMKQFLPAAARDCISDVSDLIIADNGSSDGSVDYVKKNFPEVKILSFEENLGFSGGYNRALSETHYPYTILLNSDVETTPGFWKPMLDYMEKHPDVGAVQPKIRSYRDKDSFEYAGAAGGYLDRLGYPYCRGRLFDCIEKDEGQYDQEAVDVAWASGAALMVRTDLYIELGGLDEDFFAHMEEIDLCCRMIAAGYRVCAIGSSHIYHVGGASLPKENPRKTYLNFRNNLLLLHKNLPEKKGKRILFFRRLADTLAFGMYIVKCDFKNARAILKAHSDFKKMRKNYTSHPESDNLAGFPGAGRLIVIDRYLLRKKK